VTAYPFGAENGTPLFSGPVSDSDGWITGTINPPRERFRIQFEMEGYDSETASAVNAPEEGATWSNADRPIVLPNKNLEIF